MEPKNPQSKYAWVVLLVFAVAASFLSHGQGLLFSALGSALGEVIGAALLTAMVVGAVWLVSLLFAAGPRPAYKWLNAAAGLTLVLTIVLVGLRIFGDGDAIPRQSVQNPEEAVVVDSAINPRPAVTSTPLDDDASNRLIEPDVGVGAIARETSEADLKEIYGEKNVAREAWGVGEGDFREATVLFKETHDEAWVLWLGEDYGVVDQVVITGTGWRTKEGLRVGTPIEVLNQINGRSFTFYGWQWDYGGTVISWNGGALSQLGEDVIVRLTRNHQTTWSPSFEDAVLGDQEVNSSLDGLSAVEARVHLIQVRLVD